MKKLKIWGPFFSLPDTVSSCVEFSNDYLYSAVFLIVACCNVGSKQIFDRVWISVRSIYEGILFHPIKKPLIRGVDK